VYFVRPTVTKSCRCLCAFSCAASTENLLRNFTLTQDFENYFLEATGEVIPQVLPVDLGVLLQNKTINILA
jgi:hypothetical protein